MTDERVLKPWEVERNKWWLTVDEDIYNDEYEPKSFHYAVVYRVEFPRDKQPQASWTPYRLYVEVDNYDQVHISDNSYWFGKHWHDMSWAERREVWDVLVEWELFEWRRIGPEDSELFATDKLTEGAFNNG